MAKTINIIGGCRSCGMSLHLEVEKFTFLKVNGRTTYSYTCTECGMFDCRIPAITDLDIFHQMGAPAATVVELKTILVEDKRPVGPALTEDDLIAFGRAMQALGVELEDS